MSSNNALISLDGLQSMKELYSVLLTGNTSLTDLSAFSPESVADNVLFAGNGVFPALVLPDLHTVGGGFSLTAEALCTTLELPVLDYLGGDLLVPGASELLTIDARALTRVGSVTITNNPKLTTFGGFPQLVDVDSTLTITMNPSLPQCEVDALAARFAEACTYCTDNNTSGTCN